MNEVIRLGGLYEEIGHRKQAGGVYAENSICPTLDSGGGRGQVFVLMMNYEKRQ